MDETIRLYKEELDLCHDQIKLLKEKNSHNQEENKILTKQNDELKNLVKQAEIVNQDLRSAFDKVNQEARYSLVQRSRDDPSMVVEHQLALDEVKQQCIELAHGSVHWISQKDKMIQKINFLQRECERYTRDNETLTKQVRHLLKTLEEERGTILRRPEPEPPRDPNQPITALEVIDNNLVTFSTIEQLHEQNKKLLSIVKNFAKEDEERQMEIENDDIKRLTEEVISLKKQLEEVKAEREQVIESFNTVFKERDLFKVLLCNTKTVEHMTPEIFQKMVSIAVRSGPTISTEIEDTRDKDAHISDLKEMITKLEEQIVKLSEEFQISRARLEEELKLKTELLQTEKTNRILDIKRIETLDENNRILMNDNEQLRTQNHRYVMDLEKKSELKERLEKDYTEKIQHLENLLGNTKNVCDMTSDIFQRINSIADAKESELQESSHKDAIIDELESKIQGLNNEMVNMKENMNREFAQSFDKLKEQLNIAHQELKAKEQELDESKSQSASKDNSMAEIIEKNKHLLEDIDKLEDKIQKLDHELIQRSEETQKKDPDYAKITTLIKLRNLERARRLNQVRKMRRKLTNDGECQTENAAPRIVLKRRT